MCSSDLMPVFHDGRLIGFTGASAHLLDIGGAYPGLAIDLVDNWSEGNIYHAVKLADKGVWQESLFKHILENTRTPTHNRGDIEAMIAACERAKGRFGELAARYGASWTSETLAFTPTSARDAGWAVLGTIAIQWIAQVNADGTGYLAQRTMADRKSTRLNSSH